MGGSGTKKEKRMMCVNKEGIWSEKQNDFISKHGKTWKENELKAMKSSCVHIQMVSMLSWAPFYCPRLQLIVLNYDSLTFS